MNDSHADRPLPIPPTGARQPTPRRLERSQGDSAAVRPRERQLPRYKLILHRNPALDLMFVVRSVMELTRFPRAEATHKMWEAHHNGRSVVLTTWLERAELYVEQFASKGMTTSIEPA
jgi:ATP-dependent Clp protease adaptor protein ClpS